MAKPVHASPQDEPAERAAGRVARNRLRIAWMYYVEGLTQHEIADKLGIGRVTVVRNITEAIKQREVKIWIEGEIAECLSLERELKSAYNLIDAHVVPEPSDPGNIGKAIGMAAGMYTTDQLTDDFVLGVGWGQTLYQSLQSLSPRNLKGVEVVSLLGGIVEARRFNPAEFAWQFAKTVGADCYLLTAPAIVDSSETRDALFNRCGLSTVFDHAKNMQMALLSLANISPSSTSFQFSFFTEEDRASIAAAGAVGDMLLNFFNAEGKLVDHPVNSRVMSMPVKALLTVPKRVIAAGGNHKIEAILGGMKFVKCNVLITNEATARELVNRAK